jgi:transposase
MPAYDRISYSKYKEIHHMMGYQDPSQENMFLYNIYLENRVRKDHPLRRIRELVDFDFIYKEVENKYGKNGNVSVPPPTILKLMFLFFFYNVRSERELMETIPERLDWLWFLGYTLDSPIPNHSVLSKARTRWGKDVFQHFFERIVVQCVETGLVDGAKIFVDSSLIDADASNNSVVNKESLTRYLNERYRELEKRLDDAAQKEPDGPKSRSDVNKRHASTTDPDASIVKQGGKPKLFYKAHRSVDPLCEIITAVEVTPGAINEAHKMVDLIVSHEKNTDRGVKAVVADSKYGTIDNFLSCHDKNIKAHIPFLKKTHEDKGVKKGIFSEEQFVYDPDTNTMVCPAGKRLRKRTFHQHRQSTEYIGSKKDCFSCALQPRCTKNKLGRAVHRHIHKEKLDAMVVSSRTPQAKRDIKTRQNLMERSFARGTRYGFDKARWRGLWKVNIQEYIVSAIQNIQVLIRHTHKQRRWAFALFPNTAKTQRWLSGEILTQLLCRHIVRMKDACRHAFSIHPLVSCYAVQDCQPNRLGNTL